MMLGIGTLLGPKSRFINRSPQHGTFRALRDDEAYASDVDDIVSFTHVYSGGVQRIFKSSPEFSTFLVGEVRDTAINWSFNDVSFSSALGSYNTKVPAWVSAMYDASLQSVEDEDILAMFDALEEAIYTDLAKLDRELAYIDVHRLAPEFIVGIPRALFPLNGHLLNWQPYVKRAWFALANRKLDVSELLQGLL
ncbi:hypothetical protein [Niveispirillum fermenti]|uniref:hypothetical protein n=1 Tax=Niveispirillum fermenti TaxID=1233113 RepID=UPI003A8A0B40